MTGSPLDALLERIARDAPTHALGEPPSARELDELEGAIGRPLPASFRRFLLRFGGGLFYQGHEIFGPARVMIHDIELVPSLTSVLATLRAHDAALPDGMLPFHRANGVLHFFDLRDPAQAERALSRPPGASYPDLAAFLERVVLPRA